MQYKIEVKRSVVKTLEKIPRQDQIKISQAIHLLSDNPRPPQCTKLVNSEYYRLRCGHYRIIYKIEDDVLIIIILKVGHRKDIYK